MKKFHTLICCAIFCAGGWAHGEAIPSGSGQQITTKVIAVLDGDTLLVRRNGSLLKIRLADIDAPEKAQAFGSASRDSLAEMALHKQISLHVLAVDKYGRTVAQLKVNGLSINEEMIRRGMAWEYSNYHTDRRYIALQREARQARRGLWAQNDPQPPWQWRKQHIVESNALQVNSQGDFTCGAKHRCKQMRTCDEAFYYFTVCRVKALNPKGDGVPCENLCASGSRR